MLVNYSSSSSSDSEDGEKESQWNKKTNILDSKLSILPRATTLLGKRKRSTCDEDNLTNDPSLHQGRIRSFKHERGNWATYVFIGVPLSSVLEDVQDICQAYFKDTCDLNAVSDLHISLSKTVVLQYHFIESFVKNLEDIFTPIQSFITSLSQLKVYTNAERTRTFLAVKVEDIHLQKMLQILQHVDGVMKNFKLATFYEEPSFHISILWCVGDYCDVLSKKLSDIIPCLNDNFPIELKIDQIKCKSGFKEFTFQLK
ncbi:U6 snRNA phosphodiesterase 1 [Haematobia irritans]|uniref:U6 snRNA phosphodiesterase 1 n=1 Tax=Haematobia irritans TaxID=7368 RepID=UPI003F4F856A